MPEPRHYGWQRDLPDFRDQPFVPPPRGARLPPTVDLRPGLPPVFTQGQLGSCTANAICAAFWFDMHKQGEDPTLLSRLFVYYNERKDQGTIPYDSGASIRESVKAVATYGVCPEALWAYTVSKFTTTPPSVCYEAASKEKALRYTRVALTMGSTSWRMTRPFRIALAAGYPVTIGFSVYESFESATTARTGIVTLPEPGEQFMGGHAVVVCGYGQKPGYYLLRNSWGPEWGVGGYFYFPAAYLANPSLAADFWTLERVA